MPTTILLVDDHPLLRKGLRLMFEAYKILPDHRYYYSGPESRPHAIMGIHRSYTLNSKLWKAVDISEAQLKSWLRSRMYSRLGISPNGYYIVDADGKRIGIWYSILTIIFQERFAKFDKLILSR